MAHPVFDEDDNVDGGDGDGDGDDDNNDDNRLFRTKLCCCFNDFCGHSK